MQKIDIGSLCESFAKAVSEEGTLVKHHHSDNSASRRGHLDAITYNEVDIYELKTSNFIARLTQTKNSSIAIDGDREKLSKKLIIKFRDKTCRLTSGKETSYGCEVDNKNTAKPWKVTSGELPVGMMGKFVEKQQVIAKKIKKLRAQAVT